MSYTIFNTVIPTEKYSVLNTVTTVFVSAPLHLAQVNVVNLSCRESKSSPRTKCISVDVDGWCENEKDLPSKSLLMI